MGFANRFGSISAISDTNTILVYGYDNSAHDSYSTTVAKYGGTVRHVAPSGGSDSGSGDSGSPWATLKYALETCDAGDTIFMRAGTHGTTSVTTADIASGDAVNRIQVSSYPGEWAIIDGTNGTSIGLRFDKNDYVDFESFEIKDCGNSGVNVAGMLAIDINHILFKNIYLHNCTKYGFSHYGTCDDTTYINCTSKDNVDVASGGGDGDGFHIGGEDCSLNTNTSYYRCVADGNSDDGYDAWSGENAWFEDCVALSNAKTTPSGDGDGFKMGGQSSTGGTGQHTYIRCISYSNKLRGFNDNGTNADGIFYNCIAYDNDYTGFDLNDEGTPVFVTTNCVSHDNVGGDDNGANLTITTCLGQGFGGTVIDADFESVDFADLQSGTFLKPADSTLIDQGTDVGLSYNGSAPDIGLEIV